MQLSRPLAQRGVAALMAVLFLLFMLSVVLVIAHQMAATDVYDSGAQNNSVESLFLAESGVERAAWRFANGTACNALGEAAITHGRGQFIIGNGLGTDFNGAALAANRCRIPVTGEITGAIRVGRRVEAIVERGGAGILATDVSFATSNTGPLTFAHVVAAGDSIMLVGLSVDRTSTNIASVTYGAQPLTLAVSAPGGGGGRPKAEIWFLVNPPVGTANIQISFPAGVNDQIIGGAVSFTGVNTATPFDVAAVANLGNSSAAISNITPVTDNAWVFEVVGVNNTATNLTPPAIAGQTRTTRWNPAAVSGAVRGAASTIGPINPAVAVAPRWTWTSGTERWVTAAVALSPGGPSQVVAWRELTN